MKNIIFGLIVGIVVLTNTFTFSKELVDNPVEAIQSILPEGWIILRVDNDTYPSYRPPGKGKAIFFAISGKKYIKQQYEAVLYIMPIEYDDGGEDPTGGQAQSWPPRLIETTEKFKIYLWPDSYSPCWGTMGEDILKAIIKSHLTDQSTGPDSVPAELSETTKYRKEIEKILPSGWIISNISEKGVPYNLSLLKDEKPGISFKLTGKTMVLGPRGITKEKESFTIWIMDKEYSGSKSKIQAQFLEAQILGSNEKISIYIKSFVSEIPTWKNWKKDLIELFELTVITR